MSFANIAVRGLLVTILSTFAFACSNATTAEGEDVAVLAKRAEELRSTSARFETFTGADGDVYFHLVAGNGQVTLRSEGYTRVENAKKGMEALLDVATDTGAYDVKQAKNGDWYFNVLATNGKIIGTSQLYSTKSNATRGTSTVRGLVRLIAHPVSHRLAPARERFETFTGEDGDVYFHLRAGNGEIVLSSEGYTRKANALNGISAVEENGVDPGMFVTFETASGEYAIALQAANGKTIARGESYATKSNATRAIHRIAAMLTRGVAIAD